MEQLTQLLKDGTMQILEVPFPALQRGQLLVRNYFSVISTGTEGKTVKDARLNYIGKAKARKEEVKKVIDTARTVGVLETYRMVMNKLDSPSALGYSCAGEVIAVANDVQEFKIGDLVACGGNTANHAEVVAVPVNLCVKIKNADCIREASFATLGAIALQGIRQAELRLGESCAVIGLGIIGQLTLQMLKAAGVKTAGIDIDDRMVKFAAQNSCDLALNRNDEGIEQAILNFSDGFGTDAVIITAGTDSTDPVDLAGALCRQKGKVVIVGGVSTGFKRPNYFKKELDLRMSCSYGPGRYDPQYEEEGIDYPIGYVRWTENRNMQAFTELVESGKLNIEPLITHTFDFQNAKDAYDLILKKEEPFLGIVLKYDHQKEIRKSIRFNVTPEAGKKAAIGMIGAGSFGQNFLLPALKGSGSFEHVATARPNNAQNIASKYGFRQASGNAEDVINDPKVNTVFIVTRHDTHAEFVLKALASGKNVFVEKPLCLYESELEQIKDAVLKNNSRIMLGFNRRFAPMTESMKAAFIPGQPVAVQYRINAGVVPPDHWIHNPLTGGGRILGEACHMIDLCMFLAGSKIKAVSAVSITDANQLHDTTSINLSFENGSIANVSYFSNGNKKVNKEKIEMFGNGVIAVCDDFTNLSIYGKTEKKFSGKQDKGHRKEVTEFIQSIETGNPSPVPFDDIYLSMLATFKALESIKHNGLTIYLNR